MTEDIRIITLAEIENALMVRLGDTTIEPTPVPPAIPITVGGQPVEVFLETPSSEIYVDRVFPSISIRLMSILPNHERRLSDEFDILSVDSGPEVPVITTIEAPQPKDLAYLIDTWTKDPEQDRELFMSVLTRLPDKTVLRLLDDQFPLHMYQHGLKTADSMEGDEQIYHKSMTYMIEFELYDPAATADHKAVVTFDFKLKDKESGDLAEEFSAQSESE